MKLMTNSEIGLEDEAPIFDLIDFLQWYIYIYLAYTVHWALEKVK